MRFISFISLIFIAATSNAGWDDIVATPIEDITMVGSRVEVKIKYERDLGLGMLNPDVEDLAVKFTDGRNGKLLGTARSNNDGIAKINFVPAIRGRHSIYATIIDDTSETVPIEISIYAVDKEDNVIVTDIDGTISDLPDYLIPYYGDEAPTFDFAPKLFQLLSENAHVVYLTNRDDTLYYSTQDFLNLHRFPKGTLIMNQWSSIDDIPYLGDPLRPAFFKIAVIKGLLSRGINITYGIGNADSDALAYTESNIGCYILESDEEINFPCTIFRTYRGLKSRLVRQ